jgi:hypothetical protein
MFLPLFLQHCHQTSPSPPAANFVADQKLCKPVNDTFFSFQPLHCHLCRGQKKGKRRELKMIESVMLEKTPARI